MTIEGGPEDRNLTPAEIRAEAEDAAYPDLSGQPDEDAVDAVYAFHGTTRAAIEAELEQ